VSTQLLTAEDVAGRWQVTMHHVYRLAREGRLPVVELGRYKRFRLEAIEAFEVSGGTGAEPTRDRAAQRPSGQNDDARASRSQRTNKPLRSAAESRSAEKGREVGRR
jgi:excisionase family DNA binding protein